MTQLRGFSDRYGVPQNIAVERMVDLIASLDDPMAVLAFLAMPDETDPKVVEHVVGAVGLVTTEPIPNGPYPAGTSLTVTAYDRP